MRGETIAVIGGGSVATSYLFHCATAWDGAAAAGHAPRPVRLQVFEPQARVGRGDAYREDTDTNLLNVTAGAMSVAGDDPRHFHRWLAERGITRFRDRPVALDTYLPRPLFGQYLESVSSQLLARNDTAGLQIDHVQAAVADIEPLPRGGYRLHSRAGATPGTHDVQRVVLALGNLESTAFPELRGRPGYHASPYPVSTLTRDIPRDASVGIVGTSLSAIDAVAALAAAGHEGPIWCVSRHGRLPSVRGLLNRPAKMSEAFVSMLDRHARVRRPLPLATLISAIADELTAAGADLAQVARLAEVPDDAAVFLAEEIRLSTAAPRPWQPIGNALNEVIDLAWQLLSDEDRRRFERTIRPVWMARRVTFPMDNARVLLRLLESGQLRVRGGFEGVQANEAGYRVELRSGSVQVDGLINATSFSCDATRSVMPLLQSLLARGLATPDPFGGLRLDFASGCVVRPDGDIDPQLSVLGSLSAGTYFWTNSMDVNARIAMGLARRHTRALLPA